MTIHEFGSDGELGEAAAIAVAAALTTTLATQERAVFAVPGGSAARIVLPRLLSRDLPWHQITVTLTDERWVPPPNAASNEGLVRTLLARVAFNFVGLFDANQTPERTIADLGTHVPAADVVLLGMGEDGHIASLFPRDAANAVTARFAAVNRPDHHRITLTPTSLRAAKHQFLVFTGDAKRRALARAQQSGPAEEFPVRHVLDVATLLIGA